MSWLVAIALVLLLASSCFFILVGSLGLVKLSEFFKRLHAPTKASTLGVGCVLLASVGYHILAGSDPQPRELLITAFLFITAPISAHLVARAALLLAPAQRPDQPAEGTASLPDGRASTSAGDAARSEARQAPTGKPPPRPLASAITSGVTSACS